MRFLKLLSLSASLSIATALAAPTAHANTLASLQNSCMSFDMQNVHMGGDKDEADDFTSSLTGLNVGLKAKKIDVHTTEEIDEGQFNALNAVASYFIMTGYHMELSPQCAGLPYKELASLATGTREMHWHDVVLSRPGLDVMIKSFDVSFAPQGNDIVMSIKGDDISSSRKTVLPKTITGKMTLTPSNKPPYKVVINSLNGNVAGSNFTGYGNILAGEELKDSKAHLHISITHIGPVMDAANDALSAKTNTALLIARLMARHEGIGKIGWDASLEDKQVSINGIKMPMALIGLH